MPIFDRPALLGVGVLLALVPPLLHLITRRAGPRTPLPTARFLAPDARARVWLQRRPTEIPLLLLRSLILLLLGVAAAGPSWATSASGLLDVVLLDRGVGGARWGAAVDSARNHLLNNGAAGGDLVLFDTVATHIPAANVSPALLDSLERAPLESATGVADYAVGLDAVRTAAGLRPDVDSLRVALITRPRWEAWPDGLGRTRSGLWPGSVDLVSVGDADLPDAAVDQAPPPGVASVVAGPGGGAYVRAALRAIGLDLADPTEPVAGPEAGLFLVLAPPVEAVERELLQRAGDGAVVVVAGERPAGVLGAALPWQSTSGTGPVSEDPGALILAAGDMLIGAAARAPGGVGEGGHLLAAWEDGRAAAVARAEGDGCLVYLATPLEAGTLRVSSSFPALVDALARGCEPAAPPGGALPLDAAALELLRGDDLPERVAAAALGVSDPGRRLERWLIFGALALALVETGFVYRRRRG